MSESKQKKLHYKRAVVLGENPRPLGGLILQAHGKERRPLRRAFHSKLEGGKVRLINQCYGSEDDLIYGCLLDYTEGNYQSIITLGEEEFELQISLLPPGDKEQFLEGMLFFGVQGDHVILLQSSAVRSAEFQEYLNWWLVTKTRVLEDGSFISLDNEPTRAAREKLSGVKSVVLRAPMTLGTLPETEKTPKKHGLVGDVKAQVLDILKTSGAFAEAADAGDALAMEELELSLEIRRRGRGHDGPSLLDELAHTLRHVDSDVFEIETRAGTVKGSELKLAHMRAIKTNNGVPEMQDVAEKMREYLAELLATELVTED